MIQSLRSLNTFLKKERFYYQVSKETFPSLECNCKTFLFPFPFDSPFSLIHSSCWFTLSMASLLQNMVMILMSVSESVTQRGVNCTSCRVSHSCSCRHHHVVPAFQVAFPPLFPDLFRSQDNTETTTFQLQSEIGSQIWISISHNGLNRGNQGNCRKTSSRLTLV